MSILVHKLKTLNPKKALAVISLAGLVAFSLSTSFAAAQGPQFNIFPICYQGGQNCDFPTLDGRDVTQGQGWSTSQADHDSRINANPGDVLKFSVYYHNGVPDTDENVAINAIVTAFASPNLGTPAMTHVISATIGAQNAATVSSADNGRGGNITVRIQGNVPQSLSLVPGSVQLFPNQGSTPQPGAQQMPDTVFNGGVNVGNVRGCFNFHGFVNFELQVSQNQPQQGTLTIQKSVRNVSTNGIFDDTQVSADPGQTVEFRIVVGASNNAVSNVFLKDTMDSRLSFAGSLTVDGMSVDSTGFFTNGGISLGTINPGINREIKYQATVANASQFSVGTTVLPNVATAFNNDTSVQDGANVIVVIQAQNIVCSYIWSPPLVADGSQRGLRHVGDQANVQISVTGLQPSQVFSQVNQHVSGSPIFRVQQTADAQGTFFVANDPTIVPSGYVPGDYNSFIEVNGTAVATCKGFHIELAAVQKLGLTKLVQNNTTSTGFGKQVSAQPGDRVTFQLQVSALGSNTALQNVVLQDALPPKLTYVPNTLNVNGTPQDASSFFNGGLSLGTLEPNQMVTVTFQADVAPAGSFTAGICETPTNNATVNASGNLSASDSASVQVCKQNPQKQPGSPGQRPN